MLLFLLLLFLKKLFLILEILLLLLLFGYWLALEIDVVLEEGGVGVDGVEKEVDEEGFAVSDTATREI